MKSKSLETVQNIPSNRTVLKRISENFWVPCKKSTMGRPVVVKTKRKCSFCKIRDNDKMKYGPLYKLNQVVAHYYCVLCSTRMKQNGKDNEGIMGFLSQDINSELRRSKRISCAYCREKNATVECANATCKKVFHFPCGLQNGALSRFRNDFVTYCSKHRPKQKIPKRVMEQAIASDLICAICYDSVDPKNKLDNLWAPCCVRSWFHRECVQTLAHSSGYFFRCATCNDADKFKAHMEDNGIFVPQQDASWELVPHAYEELLVRHNRCDADECKCPQGREENVEETTWEIILCRYCGSQGIHVGCGNLRLPEPQWECPTCRGTIQNDSDKTNKIDEEFNSDIPVSKPPAKSGNEDQEPAPKKRKMHVQRRRPNKRKKDKEDEGGKDGKPPSKDETDEEEDEEEEEVITDEFFIKIPEFLCKGWKGNKPHTATRPDGEEGEDEDEVVEVDSDEDVDVISVDTAWLMVEEVLSRVKPSPLSHKLKFLKNKRFAYYFDPFDVREEKVETIDLTSDTEDITSVLEVDNKTDTDSDIEIIEEVKVSSQQMPTQESEKMEPTLPDNESQETHDNVVIPENIIMPQNIAIPEDVGPEDPELSDSDTLDAPEPFEGDTASEGSQGATEPIASDMSTGATEPMVSDFSQGSEPLEILEGSYDSQTIPFGNFPGNSSADMTKSSPDCENPTVGSNDDDMNAQNEDHTVSGIENEYEFYYGKVVYSKESEGQVQNADDGTPQRRGIKHPSSLHYYYKIKRARVMDSDNSAADANNQSHVDDKSVEAGVAPNPRMASTTVLPSNLVCSMEQILGSNQGSLNDLNLPNLNILGQPKSSTALDPNDVFLVQYDEKNAQSSLDAWRRTSSTSFINQPSTSAMALSMPSTSVMVAIPSTSEVTLPSSSGIGIFMPSTLGTASLPSSAIEPESGASAPLPSFEYLTSLQANISPLDSTNSSFNLSQNASAVVQPTDTALPGSSNVFVADNDPQEPAP